MSHGKSGRAGLAARSAAVALLLFFGVTFHPGPARAETIVREAENTIRYLEDKERTRTERLWIRSAAAAEVPEIVRRLGERIRLPIEALDYEAPREWTEARKAVLAPVIGQVQ